MDHSVPSPRPRLNPGSYPRQYTWLKSRERVVSNVSGDGKSLLDPASICTDSAIEVSHLY